MTLRTPPLYDVHGDRGAEFTDFGGWSMPVEFDSIRTEHEAVREAVGIFDVSHMGEIAVTGPDAGELTDRLVTNDIGQTAVEEADYAAICDEEGVMIDDTVVYRPGDSEYLFVPNAGHDGQAYDRWVEYRDRWDLDAEVENRTEEYAMFAVQGPEAVEAMTAAGNDGIGDLSWFDAGYFDLAGTECWVSRTGYTGEDGFEVVLDAGAAGAVWTALADRYRCQPCGLGARDTLRLEAGLLLSGQDFAPEENPRTPFETGIGFCVDLDTDFVGRDALAALAETGPDEKLVGVRLLDRGIPRHGYPILTSGGEEIGEITSGTMSPTLGYPIGMGYVPVEYADTGTEVRVEIRGKPKKANVVNKRFLEGDE
jgi:aminomethyltransferase